MTVLIGYVENAVERSHVQQISIGHELLAAHGVAAPSNGERPAGGAGIADKLLKLRDASGSPHPGDPAWDSTESGCH